MRTDAVGNRKRLRLSHLVVVPAASAATISTQGVNLCRSPPAGRRAAQVSIILSAAVDSLRRLVKARGRVTSAASDMPE